MLFVVCLCQTLYTINSITENKATQNTQNKKMGVGGA